MLVGRRGAAVTARRQCVGGCGRPFFQDPVRRAWHGAGMNETMDLRRTYLHLHGGRAEPMTVDESFWPDVISGARPLPGWLVAMFEFSPADEGGHSEVHPNGDELHVCLSGSMRAVLEHDDGDKVVDFTVGETCLIPRGSWHRLVAKEPSRVVSLTFGEGSEHRPAR